MAKSKAVADLKKLNDIVSDNIDANEKEYLTKDDIYDEHHSANTKKYRTWLMLLYPDCPEHQQIMEEIPTRFPSAIWVTHDSDIDPDTGELKKEHVHYVIYFTNESFKSRVTKAFTWYKDINRFVKPAKEVKARVRYLLHLDNPDKYRYPISYLEGNIEPYKKYLDSQKREEDDVDKILLLLKYETPCSYTDLVQKVKDMGCYSTLRRGFRMFDVIFQEQLANRR